MAGNLRIAKNALYLYSRSIISMVVGIFSVRIMLEALGVEDYGLQAVAGGVLAVFSFFVGALGTSISRFITFELGRGDSDRLRDTFSTAMVVYCSIALSVVIIGETVGLWFLHNKLVIPEGREHAAEWVFHLSVLSAAIGIPQAPYCACMVAHEKFNVTSMMGLVQELAKVGIIYWVSISSFDRLIHYSTINFLMGIGSLLFIRYYSIKHFPEARIKIGFKYDLFKPMLAFSFWEMLGGLSRMLKGSGFNMVINMFFGVVINAAIGIGNTVAGAVTGLAFTVTSAFKPGIVKHYARNDLKAFKEGVSTASLISMTLYGVFAVPLLVEHQYVLHLWLKEVPEYAAEICVIQLVFNAILMATLVGAESLKSMGKNAGINVVQCVDGVITISSVALVLYLGYSPLVACAVFNIGLLFYFGSTCYLLGKHVGWGYIWEFFSRGVLKVLVAEAFTFMILYTVHQLLGDSFITLVINCMLSVICFGALAMTILLPKAQQQQIKAYLRSRYNLSRTAA